MHSATEFFFKKLNLDKGSSLPKTTVSDQNWQGFGLGEHPKKLNPYLFPQRQI